MNAPLQCVGGPYLGGRLNAGFGHGRDDPAQGGEGPDVGGRLLAGLSWQVCSSSRWRMSAVRKYGWWSWRIGCSCGRRTVARC